MFYIVVSEQGETFGIYEKEEDAQKRIKEIYKDGYCGELNVNEDYLYADFTATL